MNLALLLLCCLGILRVPLIAAETTLTSADGLTSYLYTPTEAPDASKTYWLVVGVHGLGGNGQGACGAAEWVQAFDDVIVLGPSFEPFQRDPKAPRPTRMPREIYQMSGPKHEAKLHALIADISRTWRLHPKFVLHGFSAGAQFAHRYAFKHPERVAGVSAHSAGSWAKRDGDDLINPAARGVPFVLSCGEDDHGSGGPAGTPPRIEGAKRFASELQALGFSVVLKTWPGIGHVQTTEAKALGKELLSRVRSSRGVMPD